jgi:hypothetical protein
LVLLAEGRECPERDGEERGNGHANGREDVQGERKKVQFAGDGRFLVENAVKIS